MERILSASSCHGFWTSPNGHIEKGAKKDGRIQLPRSSLGHSGTRVKPGPPGCRPVARITPPHLRRGGLPPYARSVAHELKRISTRIGSIAESATLKVDGKAKALQAAGRPVISFAAGEPDFPTPPHIVEAALLAVRDPKNHRYTPAAGLPDLREAIAAKTLRDSGLAISPSQVVVTNGGKQAVYQAFATLLDPGDEVIVPTPYWTTYPEAIRLAGGVQVDVFAGADQDYLVTVEQLEAARTPRTKVLLFVSPSNPTGAVYSPEQTKAIGEWAEEHGLWIISDEIYQNLTYPATGSGQATAQRAVSIVEAVPALADRTILVNGVAKTYAMTGWRLGWMVGPQDAMTAAANLQSHLSSNVSNISQRAGIAALTGPQDAALAMRDAFDRRRKVIVAELNKIPGMVTPTPQGAFYVYPDVTGLLGRTWRGVTPTTSLELADLILDQVEVAAVPGEAFGPSGYLRFSCALGDAQLLEGVQRLQHLFS
ncbi:pyridoxal phosphate-dependent aminotransferase [Cryobacterium algoritolerans]|uniref:Aminotransferase n=1 Tax=Cryobacterium algoritolerans TaxID=1259184 RepID=A0A4R8WXB1_9MICO|nr:pyridoxal phosphate-dependent aminotransferase [Cryobacterium algoritolerans]